MRMEDGIMATVASGRPPARRRKGVGIAGGGIRRSTLAMALLAAFLAVAALTVTSVFDDRTDAVTLDEVRASLAGQIGEGSFTVETSGDGFEITLLNDIGPIAVDTSWGDVILDINGHTVTGSSTSAAIVITGDSVEGASLLITTTTTGEGTTNLIVGHTPESGRGGDAISSARVSDIRLVIGFDIVIQGGAGSGTDGDGGDAISNMSDVTLYGSESYSYTPSTVRGGDGTDGGDGGAAIALPSGDYAIGLESRTSVIGGYGATGGPAISGSGLGYGTVNIADDAVITGGTGSDGATAPRMPAEVEVASEFSDDWSDTPVLVTVSDTSISVTLGGDVHKSIGVPAAWGDVTIDLDGYSILSHVVSSAATLSIEGPGGVYGPEGQAAVRIESGTQLTVSAGATVAGGDGTPGSAGMAATAGGVGIQVDAENVTITIDSSTVTGGAGGAGSAGEQGGAGGAAVSGTHTIEIIIRNGSSVIGGAGGAGGDSVEGDGGSGGDGGASVVNGTVTRDSTSSENGGAGGRGGNAALTSGGGSGNQRDGGDGGAGGSSVSGTGGAGGSGGTSYAGAGGSGGAGGSSVSGTGGSGGDGFQGNPGGTIDPTRVADVTITVTSEGVGQPGVTVRLSTGSGLYAAGETDANGKFMLQGVAYGTYTLSATDGGYSATQVLVVGDTVTGADIALDRYAGIEVTVSGDVTLVPVNIDDVFTDPDNPESQPSRVDMSAVRNMGAAASVDEAATRSIIFADFIDVTLTVYHWGSPSPVTEAPGQVEFWLNISPDIGGISSLVAYNLHGGSLIELAKVSESAFSGRDNCFYITQDPSGEYYAVIKTDRFSTFAFGYPLESTVTASMVGQTVSVTATTVDGCLYALYDSRGTLIRDWTEGNGTVTFDNLPSGPTYVVRGMVPGQDVYAELGRIQTPAVPSVTVVGSTFSSITISSISGVSYRLTGPSADSTLTGTGGNLTWDGLLPGTEYTVTAVSSAGGLSITVQGTATTDYRVPDIGVRMEGQTVVVTVTDYAGLQYAVVSDAGEEPTGWLTGPGDLEFGPLESGPTYTVLYRVSEDSEASVVETIPTPVVPEIVVTETTTESITIASQADVQYRLTGPSADSSQTGTGGAITWDGLSPGTQYTIVAYSGVPYGDEVLSIEVSATVQTEHLPPVVDARMEGSRVVITVTDYAGMQYAVADAGGSLVAGWSTGPGDLEFGPLESGPTYVVLTREAEGSDPVELERVETPAVPVIAVTETTTESITISSQDGVGYRLTGPSYSSSQTGTGGTITWDGLSPGTRYTITAVSRAGDLSIEVSATVQTEHLPPSVDARMEGSTVVITVTDYAGMQYAVVTDAGEEPTGWLTGPGDLEFGPLESGPTYVVLTREPGGEAGELERIETPEVPVVEVAGYSPSSVRLLTQAGMLYTLADQDGEVSPGPGGDVTAGDGGIMAWEGLEELSSYSVTVVSRAGDLQMEVGPVLVKPATAPVTGEVRHEAAYLFADHDESVVYTLVGPDGEVTSVYSEEEGRVVFGPLSPVTYTMTCRDADTGGILTQFDVRVPDVPTLTEDGGTSLAVLTEDGMLYSLVGEDGMTVTDPEGEVWVSGDGDWTAWEGLDPLMDYFLYINTGGEGGYVMFGPETVKKADRDVDVSGDVLMITVDGTQPGREYAALDQDGRLVDGWEPGDAGQVVLGPLEMGRVYHIVSRVSGSTEIRTEDVVEIPYIPEADPEGSDDTSLSVSTQEGYMYGLTDSDGNPVPGPDGREWVDGTGGNVTWTGLDPSMGYDVSVRVEDPDTGIVTTAGPFTLREAPRAEADHRPPILLISAVVLAAYVVFMLKVQGSRGFDSVAWIVTAAALAAQALVCIRAPGPGVAAMVAVTAAVVALLWLRSEGRLKGVGRG